MSRKGYLQDHFSIEGIVKRGVWPRPALSSGGYGQRPFFLITRFKRSIDNENRLFDAVGGMAEACLIKRGVWPRFAGGMAEVCGGYGQVCGGYGRGLATGIPYPDCICYRPN